MRVTTSTLPGEIRENLEKDIAEYCGENKKFQNNCLEMLEAIFLTTVTDPFVFASRGVTELDVFDDRHTSDNAIKFYLKGKHVEAAVYLRENGKVWLEINDLRYTYETDEYERQELRLPGTAASLPTVHLPTRRLTFTKAVVEVIQDLLLETKWK